MLPRAERLSAVEFSRVFECGRVLRHPLLQLRVLRHEAGSSQTAARAAFVAPKKLGKAVQRNRIRRRIRERYRVLKATALPREEVWQSLEKCDLVWIISSSSSTAKSEEVDEALTELLTRASRFIERKS